MMKARHELRGERTGRRFQLTDRVTVQVSRVDLEARKIDLRLVEPNQPGLGKPAARKDKLVPGDEFLLPPARRAVRGDDFGRGGERETDGRSNEPQWRPGSS